MKKWTIFLGVSSLFLAVADGIHGQHNGDVHRFYIHIAEFICFMGFLSLLEILTFRKITEHFDLDRWLVGLSISVVSFLAGFALFGLAGGSVHGDGGPIAVSFALMGCIGLLGVPISLVGFAIGVVIRKRKGAVAL